MLYGFGVYRSKEDGGDRINPDTYYDDNVFEKWTEPLLPFNKKAFAITEDGHLILIDIDVGRIVKVPAEGKLIIQYGAGDLEGY